MVQNDSFSLAALFGLLAGGAVAAVGLGVIVLLLLNIFI